MKFPTVILYDRNGCEIASQECEGMRQAKERARHYLSDGFAQASETTHAALGTMKVAIFAEGNPTGADTLCEWDRFHPQHRAEKAGLDET